MGPAIAALAADPVVIEKTGQTLKASDLAAEYGLTDPDAPRSSPPALRSSTKAVAVHEPTVGAVRELVTFGVMRVPAGVLSVGVLVALVIVVLSGGTARAVPGGVEVIGRSVDGRGILTYQLGDPAGSPVLVVGCTDGDEPAGIAVVNALRRLHVPTGVDLWLVPTINPDGRVARTRGNANGVDLNRNFPYAWQHLIGSFDSGPRPLSEPETRAAYRLLLRVKPRLSIWFHQPLALVDDSQGSRPLERRFARLVGLPLSSLTDYPGSITNWQNHRFAGSTAFVTELPAGGLGRAAALRYARAIFAVANALSH